MIKSKFLSEDNSFYGSVSEIDSARIGEISDDRSAIIGRNSWCFIYEGSNNYRGAYRDNSLVGLGDEWARIIESRQLACDRIGIRFVQLIVPNKATLMPENFPENLENGVTKVMERLVKSIVDANLICPYETLRQTGVRENFFRRNDSHLTIAGSSMLAEMILDAIGIEIPEITKIEVVKVEHIGDLGSKFNIPVCETFIAPRFDIGLLEQKYIKKLHEKITSGFNGTEQFFYNPSAPIKLSVMVNGNSFFERNPSWGVSPIFAALFERFYFSWTPSFDESAIRKIKPDLVISQTCERFLVDIGNTIS